MIAACANVSGRCESVKGMSERSELIPFRLSRSELIPCNYTNLILSVTSVCERTGAAIRPELKTFLSLHHWTLTIH